MDERERFSECFVSEQRARAREEPVYIRAFPGRRSISVAGPRCFPPMFGVSVVFFFSKQVYSLLDNEKHDKKKVVQSLIMLSLAGFAYTLFLPISSFLFTHGLVVGTPCSLTNCYDWDIVIINFSFLIQYAFILFFFY